MATVISTIKNIVRKDDSGILRVGKTRVSLDSVIYAFNEGATAEEIVFRYPSINLMEAYSAITYYLQNKAKLDVYIGKREKTREISRNEIEAEFSPVGIRGRLLARTKNGR
ncbi:MAG: DUF433 domain-containing protein [Pyrinomonadaceae bacterium]